MGSPQKQSIKEQTVQLIRRHAPPVGRHTLRWGWFYASILVGHMAKEEYFPFSNWPMYANFATTATYVYAVDGHGNEIGWRTTFGQTAAPVKRQYERERDRLQRELDISREEANLLGGEALMQRFARRLSADELEAMGDSLTVHYIGVRFNEERDLEHHHKATSTIQLDDIIAEKRLEESAPTAEEDQADETEESHENSAAADNAPESAADFRTFAIEEVLT